MRLRDFLAAWRPARRTPGSSRPPESYLRRFTVATVIFAACVAGLVLLVGLFVIEDLSQSYVRGVLTQAQGEAEAFARMVDGPAAMVQGEPGAAVAGGGDAALDADTILPPLQGIFEEDGTPVRTPREATGIREPAADDPVRGRDPTEVPGPASRHGGRLPATLSTEGQETQYFVNGQLIGRDAFQFLQVIYPGGRKTHWVRTVDEKDFDRSLLQSPGTITERVPIKYRPSSRRVLISWDSQLGGEPVTLKAGIDADVLDAGVAELRARIVPKVLVGSGVFVALLVLAYVYVFRLFREARALEADANQKAMLAQVGMLAAGLAHEIRNPLSAVNMNLQLLEEDLMDKSGASLETLPTECQEGSAEEHLTLLRATQREIRRLSSLVSDFLAYARPGEPHRAPHVVDSIARDCVQLFESLAAGCGVTLRAELASGDEPVLVDEAMIKQALVNVMLNAIQASRKPGGEVVVASARTPSAVELRVTDDGPGLPDDVEPLFQVFHSTKKGGSGLGLAISRALVERHGGRLTAVRGEGPGATFVISIPVEPRS